MKINLGQIFSGALVFFVAVIEAILGLRFVLMLLGASSSAEFTQTIYQVSEPLMSMFSGVFPSFQAATFTLEISTILAMIVYGIFGGIFFYLTRHFGSVTVKAPDVSNPVVQTMPQAPVQSYQPIPMAQPMAPQYPQYQQPIQTPVQPMQQNYQPPMQTPQPPLATESPIQNRPPVGPEVANPVNPFNSTPSEFGPSTTTTTSNEPLPPTTPLT